MKLFDFNIHLPQKISDNVNEVIEDDMHLTVDGLMKGLHVHSESISRASGVNVLLFNQKIFKPDATLRSFTTELKSRFEKFLLTALIDFRAPSVDEYLRRAKANGVNAIMFNSYLQKIREGDFVKVLDVCKLAEANKQIICIDGSYGTSKMYEFDNMKLACFVADHVEQVPIVIIHSGGYRILEAMLLAMDKKNVMLDTSFSLNYYLGSSIEQDYAFAYKRLGSKRILFGSDIPYVNFNKIFNEQLNFFQKFSFSSSEVDDILFYNASYLADEYGA